MKTIDISDLNLMSNFEMAHVNGGDAYTDGVADGKVLGDATRRALAVIGILLLFAW